MIFANAFKAYFFRTERNILDDRFNRTIKHCSWDFPGEGLNGEGWFMIYKCFVKFIIIALRSKNY